MSAPQVVLWDADGVLQRVPGGGEESMRPALEGRVEDVDGCLARAVREERPALRGEVRWLDVLPGLLEEWGIADSYDEVLRVWLTIEPVPEARALVTALRGRGVPGYLASNQDRRRAAHMHAELGYPALLDGEFYSCDLGAAKPETGYFTAILDRLSLAPAQVLLVDDNPGNVEAARSVGLAAECWSYRENPAVLRGHLLRHELPV